MSDSAWRRYQVRSSLVDIDRRQRRGLQWRERLTDLRQDAVFALRALRREPRFTVGVVLTLGLGIAANATMFGVVDRLLLRGPAGVANPAAVRRLYLSSLGPEGEAETASWVGYISYTTLRDRTRAFSAVGAYTTPDLRSFGNDARLLLVPTAGASWDLFVALGLHPEVGRFFTRSEDSPEATAQVAIISDALWADEFGRDRAVVGSPITVDGARYTVIGVAPAGFNGPDRLRTDVWLPITLRHPCDHWTTTIHCSWMQVVARPAPGVSPHQADAEATRVLRVAFASGDPAMRKVRALMRPLWYGPKGTPSNIARVAEWLLGVAVIVLLITCANITNLLLARARRRHREIAVRLALGAGSSRLFRLMLTEAACLSLGGAALALGLCVLGGRMMRATLLSGVALDGAAIDARVFVITLVLAAIVAVGVGTVAAIEAIHVNVAAGLKETASAGGGRRHSVRAILSGAQAALSVVLLVGAGLFMLSLHRSEHVSLGFEAQRVLTAQVRIPAAAHIAGATAAGSLERLARTHLLVRTTEETASQPWVEHASVSVGSPFGNSFGVSLKVPGRDSIPQLQGGGPYISAVTSEYFATVGTPLVGGRLFRADEHAGTPPVTIVNETMARLLWPGENPLGKCLIIGDDNGPCASVVGVVGDVHRESISESPTMQYYVPLGQEHGIGGAVILVRPRGSAEARIELTRKTLSNLSGVRDVRVKWMESIVDPEYAPYRLGATMFGIFGVLALIIASIGLYSVIAYLVADRTREIGVRLALGAGSPRIVRQVVATGATTAGIGIAVGLVASVIAAPQLEPLLFQVHARNGAVLGAAAAVVLLIALLATWAPARRASRVDPVIALRTD